MLLSRLSACLTSAQSITLTARRRGQNTLVVAVLPHFPPLPGDNAPASRHERERFERAQTPLVLTGSAETIEGTLADALERLVTERVALYQAASAAIREIDETERALRGTGSPTRAPQTPAEAGARDDADDFDLDNEPIEDHEKPPGAAPATPSAPGILPLFPDES